MYARTLARSIWNSVFSHLVGALVEPGLRAAKTRRNTLLLIGGIAWAVLAYILHPYVPNSDPMLSLLLYPFRSLFAADVLKHVLVSGFVFWFAYRAAAIYLDDIFELKNTRMAERFIRQSAFASKYDVLEIKQGEVSLKSQESPMYLIGGPGKVRVYLENAAVFEQVGGMPHVIGPTVKRSKKSDADRSAGKSFLGRSQGLLAAMLRFDRPQRLHLFVQTYMRYHFDMMHEAPRLNELVENITTNHTQLIHERNQNMEKQIASILQQAVKSGEFQVENIERTASAILRATVYFTVPLFMHLYTIEEFEKMAVDVVALIINGLRKTN